MTTRQIGVSSVAYDGYPLPICFDELARIGINLVEPAYINGYMVFTEADFEEPAIQSMNRLLKDRELRASAISAHMDCGADGAEAMLARRIRFTAGIGAQYTITNSTTPDRLHHLRNTLESNLRLAEELGVIIALENPGHGRSNLMVNAERGAELIKSFNSPHLRMNYDTSNALTCTEGDTRPETDIEFALPVSAYMHLKDAMRIDGRWRYTVIGAGEIDYRVLFHKLAPRPDIPLTLELPLRLKRVFYRDPERETQLTPLPEIAAAIERSWAFCADNFADVPALRET